MEMKVIEWKEMLYNWLWILNELGWTIDIDYENWDYSLIKDLKQLYKRRLLLRVMCIWEKIILVSRGVFFPNFYIVYSIFIGLHS